MEQKKYTAWITQVFSPRRLKIGIACLLVCVIAAGGGAWYYHQQKVERKYQIRQAQTRMVEYQAAQRNIQLINTDDVKAMAAQAVGQDEASLQFREISLENKWDDKAYRNARRDRGPVHGAAPAKMPRNNAPVNAPVNAPTNAPTNASANSQANSTAPQQGRQVNEGSAMQEAHFFPVYEVECSGGGLKYELEINAVTGEVLGSEVESHSIIDEVL